MDLKFSDMNLIDLNNIKDILYSDFDDFWDYDTLKEELQCSSSFFKVVKNDDVIIGFAGFKVILDEADIMNIVVKKDYRHNKVGSILLQNLVSFAKSLNLKTITLEVNENNLFAIQLYNKFDFRSIGIRKNYYDGINNAIIMSKLL